ncbi:hypothetical protein SUDANB95_04050 [Actinosynnema sp. ALI-1.44]
MGVPGLDVTRAGVTRAGVPGLDVPRVGVTRAGGAWRGVGEA